MTTETTTAPDTTQADAGTATTGAEGATTGGNTVLTGGEAAGKTAGDVEAGKGAETGAEGKSTEGDGKATDDGKGDATKAGPPEKYEFTMPEGVQLDTALLEKAEPILRELSLTNEQANKLANVIAEQRVLEAQRQSEAYAQQVDDWGKQAREDKEFGGAAFETNVAMAQKALGAFGTPELKAFLSAGLGNHPELIRAFVKVGKAMGEDGGVSASSKTPAQKASAVLFDHPTSQTKR